MLVVGGVYHETCLLPPVSEIFGSGGRAAVALTSVVDKVKLHGFYPADLQNRAISALSVDNLELELADADSYIEFRYVYSLGRPEVYGLGDRNGLLSAENDNVLLFGMLEGSASVKCKRLVVDPQSGKLSEILRQTSYDELVLVLNHDEVVDLNEDEAVSVATLHGKYRASVIVVKGGAAGARVYVDGVYSSTAPPFQSESVYKIGSGDIFSAAFAYSWIEVGASADEAARFASWSTARYCETRTNTLVSYRPPTDRAAVEVKAGRKVYIAAPFFQVHELWLVDEVAKRIAEVGGDYFSPYHDVGVGPPKAIAEPDLNGLRECSAVIALVGNRDPGTLFEIGYAVANRIPVVALSENPSKTDDSMLVGTDCFVTKDLTTAIYKAVWASWG